MIKVGIIGFGKMGKIRAHAIESCGEAEVDTVFDPHEEITAYHTATNPMQILEEPKIDAVFICTPNHLNKSLTIAALRAGKNVFCEKPPAFNAEEVAEVQSVEAKSKKVLMYGFNHRHHESIKAMKSYIDSAEFGRILWMRGRYGKSVDDSFYDNWRADKKLAGGGILIDQGIHMLDIFLHFCGSFDEVHAVVSNLYWNLDIEDNVFATFKNTETGVVASLHSTMTQWRHLFSLEVFLERGYLVLNGLKTPSNSYGPEVLAVAKNRTTAPAAVWEDEEQITYQVDNSWLSEAKEFFAAVREKRSVGVGTSRDAHTLMKVIDECYRNGSP